MGSNRAKTYYACLDYDGPLIPGGAVQLGHIIANISEPSASLNDPVAIPKDIPVSTAKDVDWTQQTSKNSSKTLEIFLDIPLLQGFRTGFRRSHSVESEVNHEYQFEQMKSLSFKPTSEYYAQSIAAGAAPGVQSYLRATKFKLPLYMVVGLKEVAGGGRLRKDVTDSVHGMRVETQSRRRGETVLDDNRYVFAIEVVKLKCSKDGKIRSAEYNEGATLVG